MNKNLLIILILAGAFLYGLFLFLEVGNKENADWIGNKALDFTVFSETGEAVRLSDLRGKVVMLHFWGTWCPPCREEFPSVNQIYRQFKDKAFVLLAVSQDEKKEDVEVFRKQIPFDFTIYYDPTGRLAESYGTFALPETYLIDKNGIVVDKAVGPQYWQDGHWEAIIARLVNQ